MGTPRSEKGFNEAIEELNSKISEIDTQLVDVDPDSEEEANLIQSKAELGVELADLETKFEAFKEKQSEGSQDEEQEETPPSSDDSDASEDEKETPTEKVWPKTVEVRAKSKVGFMVNPFNHTRITEDWKEVITDNWTINQIEAGLLDRREA